MTCIESNMQQTSIQSSTVEEEVFYDAQMEQFNEEEGVYSNPSSSELANKMRETRNRIRIRELINAWSIRDTALYNIKDRLARAGP